jgi:hypothetical protein
MTRLATVKAGSMIEAAIVRNPDGSVLYRDGVTDQTIADEVAAATKTSVQRLHIERLRRELGFNFVKIAKPKTKTKVGAIAEDIELIKAQIDTLIDVLVEYGFPDAAKARIAPKS